MAPRGRLSARALSLLVSAIALGASTPAAAASPASTEAAEASAALKARGNEAMVANNPTEALSYYQQALEKNPNDVTLQYNIGRAHQARGEYVEALASLQEFERAASPEIRAKVPALDALLSDVRSRIGSLTIQCSVEAPKATVLIGATAKVEGCSRTPRRVSVSLASRSETLDVHLASDSFRAPSVMVTLDGGAPPVAVELALSPIATTGVLYVKASPARALVSIDGAPKGNSPLEIVLPAGSHVIDVTATSYERARVPVVIEAGGRREVDVTLDKTPPITTRWWFWTAAGVVVAGAAAASAILIIQPEKSPTKGSIHPGIVQAPLVTF